MLLSSLIFLAATAGCEVNRARSADPEATTYLTAEEVRITGPCSISQDGSVTWTAVPRPDGDLIGTQIGRSLPANQIEPWIRETTARKGGAIGRARSIVGPYRIEPDDMDSPLVYDITLEIWKQRDSS